MKTHINADRGGSHDWYHGVCTKCYMKKHWPGARYSCRAPSRPRKNWSADDNRFKNGKPRAER
jgi:hypothetical protein